MSVADLNNLQNENQNLQFTLGERDVEIERMKTTLIALNEKLAVTDDIRLDCDQYKKYFADSEQDRKNLQSSMTQTSADITRFQNENSTQHKKLESQIQDLQQQLADQKAHQARRENDHAAEVERIQK
jgi:chromosome segregation ATPase